MEEQRHRLVVGMQGGGPFGGTLQGQPRLGRERGRLGSLPRKSVRGEVVAREGAGHLVRAQTLKEARRRHVARLAVLPRQRVVGHLADQRLHERELAQLR